jgi:hypothetical protein
MDLTMDIFPSQNSSISKSDAFLLAHPEIQVGRFALRSLQSTYSSSDSFSVINKPFDNMVLHQEFNADTRERIYVVALVNDQKALDDYEQDYGALSEDDEGFCAENHGPDHLIYDRVVEYKIADCEAHKSEPEPDPNCSACWPILCGSKCIPNQEDTTREASN